MVDKTANLVDNPSFLDILKTAVQDWLLKRQRVSRLEKELGEARSDLSQALEEMGKVFVPKSTLSENGLNGRFTHWVAIADQNDEKKMRHNLLIIEVVQETGMAPGYIAYFQNEARPYVPEPRPVNEKLVKDL